MDTSGRQGKSEVTKPRGQALEETRRLGKFIGLGWCCSSRKVARGVKREYHLVRLGQAGLLNTVGMVKTGDKPLGFLMYLLSRRIVQENSYQNLSPYIGKLIQQGILSRLTNKR